MKKHLALLSLFCACGFLAAQEIPAPNAPDTVQAKQKVQKAKKQRPQNRVMQHRIEKLKENSAKILSRFDADKDGKLNDSEKAAMEKTFAEAHELFMLSMTYKSIQAVDTDGNLILSDSEIKEAPAKLREMHARRKQQMQERARQKKMAGKK